MELPFFKVSNTGTQYVDYSNERKNQMSNRIRVWKGKTASGQVELDNRNSLYEFIPKSMGFINQIDDSGR